MWGDLALACLVYAGCIGAVLWALVVVAIAQDAFAADLPPLRVTPRLPRTERACAGFYGVTHG